MLHQGITIARVDRVLTNANRRNVLEMKTGGRLQFHGVGDGQSEWPEVHLLEIQKSQNFRVGACDLFIICYEGVHLFVNAPKRKEGIWPT